jgi:hypothetical protein
MKATQNTASKEDLPRGAGGESDPDFNDPLPHPIDPDASEFRDQIQVENYASVGAVRAELEDERRQQEQATLDVLEAMRAMDAGDQVKWRISRSGHENDELNGYLETWPNHQMTIERLRDRFGGGTYYCKGFRKGKYVSHETLQVSGEAKRKPSGIEGMNQSVPVAPAGPGFDLQAFMAAQERRDERRREDERRERLEREEREEKRRAERLQLLLTLGPAAISALGGAFGGRQVDYLPLIAAMKGPDPLTVMAQLKALDRGGSDGVMTKVLPMLIDMAGQRASSGDTGWLDVVKELAKSAGPTVGALIENSVQQARANAQAQQAGVIPAQPPMEVTVQPMPPTPAAPSIVVPEPLQRKERRTRFASEPSNAGSGVPVSAAGGATTAGSSSNGTTPGGDPNMLGLLALAPHLPWLREQLARMGNAAVKGRDPEVYAALFLEELPDAIPARTVLDLLTAADWYQKLCQVEPRLNREDLVPWFTKARDRMVAIVSRAPELAGGPSTLSGSAAPAAVTPAPTPVAKPKPNTGEIQRPTKLPSLTGD